MRRAPAGAPATELALLGRPEPEQQPQIRAWALVELFGHQRIVGHCTSEAFGNAVLLRIDVPDLLKDGQIVRAGFTRYFGMGAIYSVTPITEERVRALLPMIDGTPSRPLSLHSYSVEDE